MGSLRLGLDKKKAAPNGTAWDDVVMPVDKIS